MLNWQKLLALPRFQSTPGLVTRRNNEEALGTVMLIEVSIHSWSSYQEKLT